MTATEIAAEIRSAIKAAQKSGDIPAGCKVSVRSGYASLMQEVRVKIAAGEGTDICGVSQRLRDLLTKWSDWDNGKSRFLSVTGTCAHRTHEN